MELSFAAVMVGLAFAVLAAVLLTVEFARGMQRLHQRPQLPEADRPPRSLGLISVDEVPAEVSRGMARLIGELREAARGE